MSVDCIFCKIIKKQIPASVIAENERIIVIKDISPQAPIHYLIIPKQHIVDIGNLTEEDREIAADLLMMAQELSHINIDHRSFKLVNNNGPLAGQMVFHIHIHFLAGY